MHDSGELLPVGLPRDRLWMPPANATLRPPRVSSEAASTPSSAPGSRASPAPLELFAEHGMGGDTCDGILGVSHHVQCKACLPRVGRANTQPALRSAGATPRSPTWTKRQAKR